MRILRKKEAEAKCGIGDRHMRDLERRGLFPKRFRIVPGGRDIGYLESEIDEWIANRIAEREAA